MTAEQRPIRVAVVRPEAAPAPGRPEPAPIAQTPLIDIHEGPEGLILEADVPGASEEDVIVQVEDNILSLRACVAPPVPAGARALHEEYHVGEFQRSFILSDEVERGRISAELRNGVLRLVLPKAEAARPRRIEIATEIRGQGDQATR
jgi:HSP20 family protein